MVPGERFNGYSHLAGLLLAGAGALVLLDKTLGDGDPARAVAAAVFSAAMLSVYGASTLLHGSRGAARRFWERADHCAIFLLIAGTYTPLGLVTLKGPVGWALLAAVWLVAAWGILRELRARAASPSLALYLGMGWIGLLAVVPLVERLPAGALAWLLAGAAIYSAGTYFYVNRPGLRHAHGIWHLFVMGGTASHYVVMNSFVL